MEKEENRKQCVSTDELMEKLREQVVQIRKAVEGNDDEMCAFVIISNKDKTLAMMHSNPSSRIMMAITNAAVRDGNILLAMDLAVQEAWDYIGQRGGSTSVREMLRRSKEDRT